MQNKKPLEIKPETLEDLKSARADTFTEKEINDTLDYFHTKEESDFSNKEIGETLKQFSSSQDNYEN